VKVCPPIVIVPDRVDAFGFAAALKLTLPLPVPVAPAVTVNQLVLLLTAVHVQPAGDVTDVEPVPPPATTDCDVGASANVQPTPAWVTVKVWPAAVSVPTRCSELAFAATL
jgi:hypothetical protein